jgi:hypothetical protein
VTLSVPGSDLRYIAKFKEKDKLGSLCDSHETVIMDDRSADSRSHLCEDGKLSDANSAHNTPRSGIRSRNCSYCINGDNVESAQGKKMQEKFTRELFAKLGENFAGCDKFLILQM